MNDYESAAMWEVYTKSDEAVAIQSTYQRLRDCLPDEVEVGEVRYIDYTKEAISLDNIYNVFTHKRKSFQYEQELRAVYWSWPPQFKQFSYYVDQSDEDPRPGYSFPVNLNQLVEAIYVAPLAPSWFLELVESACQKYGLNKDVIHSSLSDSPLL